MVENGDSKTVQRVRCLLRSTEVTEGERCSTNVLFLHGHSRSREVLLNAIINYNCHLNSYMLFLVRFQMLKHADSQENTP